MCERGQWRGFHTRYIKTPGPEDDPLVIVEQCTECSSYRARDMGDVRYVKPTESESDTPDLPDPDDGDRGSVWSDDGSGDDIGW